MGSINKEIIGSADYMD